jgi:outer membrane biosynthesis protein TonB
MKGRIKLLALILALLPGGCAPHTRKFVLPAAPAVAVAKPLPEPTIETPPEIDTPVPIISTQWPQMSPAQDPKTATHEQEKKPQPVHTPAPSTTQVEPEQPAPVVPPAPTPRLGEVLTDARHREYEADFGNFMAGARAAMNRASSRSLTAQQKDTVANIRVFLKQAEDSRSKDLALARELARRAYLLGQDLLKSLR